MQTPLIITRNDFAGRVELAANMADAKINNRILEAQDFDLRELMGNAFYYDFIAKCNTGIGNFNTDVPDTSALDGTYVNMQAISTTGVNALFTAVVLGNLVIQMTRIDAGSSFVIGDNFYFNELPGAQFSVVTNTFGVVLSYLPLYSGGSYLIKTISYNFYGIVPVLVYYATSRLVKNLDIHFTPDGVRTKRNEFSDPLESKDISWRANQFVNQGIAYWNMCVTYLDANTDTFPLWKSNTCCDDERGRSAPKMRSLRGDNTGYNNDTSYIFIR